MALQPKLKINSSINMKNLQKERVRAGRPDVNAARSSAPNRPKRPAAPLPAGRLTDTKLLTKRRAQHLAPGVMQNTSDTLSARRKPGQLQRARRALR